MNDCHTHNVYLNFWGSSKILENSKNFTPRKFLAIRYLNRIKIRTSRTVAIFMSRESSLPLPLPNRGREGPTLNGAVLASIFEVSPFLCRIIALHLFNYINDQKRKGEGLSNKPKQTRHSYSSSSIFGWSHGATPCMHRELSWTRAHFRIIVRSCMPYSWSIIRTGR